MMVKASFFLEKAVGGPAGPFEMYPDLDVEGMEDALGDEFGAQNVETLMGPLGVWSAQWSNFAPVELLPG